MGNRTIIITGGQTGVDRAALDIAIKYNVKYCGYIPKGRKAESGTVPEKYKTLIENKTPHYSSRTLKNVLCASGVILCFDKMMDEGTRLTCDFALRFQQPLMKIDLSQPPPAEVIRQFIMRYKVIDIAGPRQSNAPGIYEKVYALLDAVFKDFS